jgi:GNAT superfamily N-acetyltransferase
VPTWAVACFYIDPRYRGSGVGGTLLAAAAEHARTSGAIAVEGYPIDPSDGQVTNASAFTGVLDMFRAAGFDEIERRGGRPILRRTF